MTFHEKLISMKTLDDNSSGDTGLLNSDLGLANRLGIMLAMNWHQGDLMISELPFLESDYVVVKWTELYTGKDERFLSKIEAKTTIAICRRFEDANLIFENYEEAI